VKEFIPPTTHTHTHTHTPLHSSAVILQLNSAGYRQIVTFWINFKTKVHITASQVIIALTSQQPLQTSQVKFQIDQTGPQQ
jgi:hypothetical protein